MAAQWLLLLFVPLLAAAVKDDCGPCDPNACLPPTECLAGLVKDRCDCCFMCGRREGERCDHKAVPSVDGLHYGACGEHLDCKVRDDLAPEDPLEAICYCKQNEVICGTDNKTYLNICQMMEEAYRKRNGLKVAKRGPCQTAPWIATGPEDVTEKLGANVALACEAMGYPIPSIEWQVTRSDGVTVELPNDDQHIAVQARGGPEQFEITGWLQLLDIQIEDDGTYHCVAKNSEGEAKASARVMIKQDSSFGNDL